MERAWIVPEWEGSVFQQWAKNFCAKNQWRVAKTIGDYEDCMSECALGYVECRKRYGQTTNEPKHFMYMYKLWMTSVFNTFSTVDSNNREMEGELSTKEPTTEPEGELAVKLSGASSELKDVLKILMSAPQEILDTMRADASSCHPKQFFRAALKMAGIPTSKSSALTKELQTLLGK